MIIKKVKRRSSQKEHRAEYPRSEPEEKVLRITFPVALVRKRGKEEEAQAKER